MTFDAYKYKVGQTVKVKLPGDSHHGKIGRIAQQHHGRNVVEFPNKDKRDFLDSELKRA
jgi:hypothetical protein